MTPVLQSRPHPNGDCTRACVAALLDLSIEQVPDFTGFANAMEPHETGYPTWYLAIQEWLASKGYTFIEIHLDQRTWMPLPLETLAIFIGQVETLVVVNNPGEEIRREPVRCRHAIVGKCEGEAFFPIFDPLGGDPTQAFVNGHIEAVCFLVPIDPALQLRLGKATDNAVRLARQLKDDPAGLKENILANLEGALNVGKAIEIPELNRAVKRSDDEQGG